MMVNVILLLENEHDYTDRKLGLIGLLSALPVGHLLIKN